MATPTDPAAARSRPAQQEVGDDRGLSIDMLNVDRLREWARLLLVHGADISHWGSVPYVAGKMQILATNIERAVREIGSLRSELAALAAARLAVQQENEQLKQQLHELRQGRSEMRHGYTLARGICPFCQRDRPLATDGTVLPHRCPPVAWRVNAVPERVTKPFQWRDKERGQ